MTNKFRRKAEKYNNNMYKIISNASGTRCIDVTEENFDAIRRFALFRNLVDSNGIVDEDVLEKLRLNVRDIVESTKASDKGLMDLCFDVIYHPNMKATALHNLIVLYTNVEAPSDSPDGGETGAPCVISTEA